MSQKIKRAPCRGCHQETKHLVLAARTIDGEDEASGIDWRDTYELLECSGCEQVSLCNTFAHSAGDDLTVTYYPPPVSRRVPPWRGKLPHELGSVLGEVYAALDADSRRLALMGARTAIDIALLEKVGDSGTFQEKLASLEKKGFVGKQNREILAAALDAGNAAAHRGFRPKPEDLATVMDIVENVLQSVYVLEGAAAKLRKATPKRQHTPTT